MSLFYFFADLIQTEAVIDVLQEEIPDVESLLFIFADQFLGGAADDDLALLIVLFPVKFLNVIFSPLIRVPAGGPCLYLFDVAEFFNSDGSDLAVFANGFLDIETDSVFRFGDGKFQGIVPPQKYYTIYS